MKKLLLGFSTGVYYPTETSINVILRKLLTLQNEVVEINLATPQELQLINDETLELVNQFSIKTIHAPFKNIRYGIESEKTLHDLVKLAETVNPKYVLFHPDTVDDFSIITSSLGSLAAFENMDVRKSFGNTVEDLKNIFTTCPEAGWVCDLNHVFTIDPSMKLARTFHEQLGSKLVGYHISGYQDEDTLHTCLYKTGELPILHALEDYTVPIIHEGGFPDDPDFLQKEWQFIQDNV